MEEGNFEHASGTVTKNLQMYFSAALLWSAGDKFGNRRTTNAATGLYSAG